MDPQQLAHSIPKPELADPEYRILAIVDPDATKASQQDALVISALENALDRENANRSEPDSRKRLRHRIVGTVTCREAMTGLQPLEVCHKNE